MNILYIENDIVDIKNCQLLLSGTAHHLKIAYNFEESIPMLISEDIDLVLSSRSIGENRFSEYWKYFFGMPYFILLNQVDHTLKELRDHPIHPLQ